MLFKNNHIICTAVYSLKRTSNVYFTDYSGLLVIDIQNILTSMQDSPDNIQLTR